MRNLSRYWKDSSGAAAAEMALILPALMFLVLGTIYLSLLGYAWVNLNSATDAAARYASVTAAASGASPVKSDVEGQATKFYKGFNFGPTFTYQGQTGACGSTGNNGYLVTASGAFPLFFGFGRISVPLSTTACFP
jgi:Flp pilus assembly protein TadG